MKDATVLAAIAMLCLTIIEVMCLFQGIDSVILVLVVSAIAGIAGYEVKAWRDRGA